jgi:cytochrome c-L
MYGALNMNEMLLVMAWVRHVYKDNPKDAVWLTSEQRSTFKPFDANAPHIEPAEELLPQCGGPAG